METYVVFTTGSGSVRVFVPHRSADDPHRTAPLQSDHRRSFIREGGWGGVPSMVVGARLAWPLHGEKSDDAQHKLGVERRFRVACVAHDEVDK
ncbi:rhoptry neck protein ron8 [Sesbania bispinosa]|nr:rhoptry neck protein ron8 [Sesbania bispinosa]